MIQPKPTAFNHANETLLGESLGARRDRIVLSTKFGLEFDGVSKEIRVAGHPDTIRQSCEDSLRRLRTDHIDLYYQHRVNPKYPIEDVWGVLTDLVTEGKVRYLGMSEPSISTLRTAHAIHPVTAVQNEYSLFTRDPEDEILPVLRELHIGLVCYAPLGRGFLSGAFRREEDFPQGDFRRHLPRYRGENLQRNVDLVDRVAALGKNIDLSPAQIALAWLIAHGPDIVPIPGMEIRKHLHHNLRVVDVQLTTDQLDALQLIVPTGAYGARYEARFLELSNPDLSIK